ncbi:MAG: hypothetical protein HYV07_00970 [Deltaproteobacteria bacterium]|nr:hypothetical protein [Deltaproteobacteria bacterium]
MRGETSSLARALGCLVLAGGLGSGCGTSVVAVVNPAAEDAIIAIEVGRTIRGLWAVAEGDPRPIVAELEPGSSGLITVVSLERGLSELAIAEGEISLSSANPCGARAIPSGRVFVGEIEPGMKLTEVPELPHTLAETLIEGPCRCRRFEEIDRWPIGSLEDLGWVTSTAPYGGGLLTSSLVGAFWLGTGGEVVELPIEPPLGRALAVDGEGTIYLADRMGLVLSGPGVEGPFTAFADVGESLNGLAASSTGTSELFALTTENRAFRVERGRATPIEFRLSGLGLGGGGQEPDVDWLGPGRVLLLPRDVQESVLVVEGQSTVLRNLRELGFVEVLGGEVFGAGRGGAIDRLVGTDWVNVEGLETGVPVRAIAPADDGFVFTRRQAIAVIPAGAAECEETEIAGATDVRAVTRTSDGYWLLAIDEASRFVGIRYRAVRP